MHHLEVMQYHQQCYSKLQKIEENYDALHFGKLYTVICQTGRLFGDEKLTNADILLFQFNFSDRKYS